EESGVFWGGPQELSWTPKCAAVRKPSKFPRVGGPQDLPLGTILTLDFHPAPSPAGRSSVDPCEGVQCPVGQHCRAEGRKTSCVRDPTAVCRAQGDPHYITFDGRPYDMMGTCSYTMAELCGQDDTLPAFSVNAKNEHRNSRLVSYVGYVTVLAYSHSVSLARGEVGFTRVSRSRLPASLSEGRLRVYQSGTKAVVELDFGLVVTYDWDSQLAISLPERFQNQVCGLCGNYNNNPGDDLLTPDGTLVSDIVEFASSWKLDDGDDLCDDGCQNNCPSCTPDQTQQYGDSRVCGVLTVPEGPFAACHESLDPHLFLENCIYDLCATGGERISLCRALGAYAQACTELGISVGDWRQKYNCLPPSLERMKVALTEMAGSNRVAGCGVEGCVCREGFVMSGGACVPASSCGCTYEGQLLAPGQAIWADDQCSQRCTCDGATHTVSCQSVKGCPEGELCEVQNDLLGCYPTSFGSCQASGDPHYVSFDGRRFDFMGTCMYLLVGSCGQDPALPTFRVLVENEHRGSKTVSYTRAVRVEADGVEVALNGILQYLPFQAADGRVQVFRQGRDAVVRTDFGLTVTYNWDALVTVKVPSSYAKALCGLCGNFNGDPSDDLALRGGGQAANALDFGNSWQEEPSPDTCGAGEPGNCPKLDSLVTQQVQSKKECGILADSSGPFRECHGKVDPQGAVRDCVYDLCLLPGQSELLCEALAAYAEACQAAGATVQPWRTEEFCPLTCPPHSHYEACSRGCPLSCGDLPVPGGCGTECYEGCVCDDGFALSGDSCVPLASCGCVHQGTYYQPGQSFYPGPGCETFCHCQEGGLLSCEPSSCGPQEACQPSNGVLGCVAVGSVTCQASGDPHYTSFDGRRFDFMGTCVYVLAQTCKTRPGLPQFTVLQENAPWGNGKVSATKVITVLVANHTLRLEQMRWTVKVRVDGVDQKLPVELAEGAVRAFQHGSDVVVETDFGLRVAYDLMYYVRVTVPGNYYKQMCGLCGDYNGDPKDDFQNPELEEKYKKEQFCGLLASSPGPLANCHKLVAPEGPLEECVFDLCLGEGNLTILCSNIHAYVSACQAAGGHVEPWRTESFCPMECPPHSHYKPCANTCSLSCSALSAPLKCPEVCAEGCECDPDYLYNGQACVPIQECGCYYKGIYYEVGAQTSRFWADASCSQRCHCGPKGGSLSCTPGSCGLGEQCTLLPSGQHGCQPVSTAECQAWGDPHYTTLDGHRFDFQGTCEYLLSGPCPEPPKGTENFTVTRENPSEGRGTRAGTSLPHVTPVCLPPHPQVNGVLTTLPVSVAGGRISVTHGASKAVLVTDFGLQVTYDWNWQVEVKLPSSYRKAVCGLCGNMDKNASNDQVFPNGTVAPSIPTWGGSWRVPDWDPFCWDECKGSCPTCPEERLEEYKGPSFCGPLAPNANGPFTSCHAHLPPENYFKGCVLDVCLGGGTQDILCQALAAYAAACQAAGITIKDWRTQAGCGECWGGSWGRKISLQSFWVLLFVSLCL
uniref:VWFD domain-containing protein n=1 Tax=Spermophilus dauricus TaxID=99837 RepID=A0A8C9NX71_SPEDA